MKKTYLFLMLVFFISCTGCSKQTIQTTKDEKSDDMQIMIKGEQGEEILFLLNNSQAANALYEQLPMSVEVDNFRDNEKIFYPKEKLDVHDTPMATGANGILAYYEPWGDVIMFYEEFTGNSGLYALGEIISGFDQIQQLQGNIEITKYTSKQSNIEQEANAEVTQEQTMDLPTLEEAKEDNDVSIQIIVDQRIFNATLEDNASVQAFIERLPMTIAMDELHGNEKYYYFSKGLPTETELVSQINTGDLKLFGNDCLVLFYQDFSTSYSYTTLGRVDDSDGLAQALGNGRVEIRFEQRK